MTREEINQAKQKEIFKERNKEIIKRITKITIKLLVVILLVSTIFFSYTTYISSVKINTREYRIINNKIPDNFNGTKIIQFSDLHYGTTMNLSNLKEIVNLINETNPDLVFFTGDLIDKTYELKNNEQEKIIKQLQKINSTLGKYAILGEEDNESFTTIMNSSNFTILKNEYELIYKDTNNPILLVGLNNQTKDENSIQNAYKYFTEEIHNPDIFSVTLTHEPDTVDLIDPTKTDLILAGHSHNGSVRIPFINKALFNKEGAKKYNQDYYSVNDNDLYISSGLGTNNYVGFRLFCRPTISLYRISNK